jgi:hypothetical protein
MEGDEAQFHTRSLRLLQWYSIFVPCLVYVVWPDLSVMWRGWLILKAWLAVDVLAWWRDLNLLTMTLFSLSAQWRDCGGVVTLMTGELR